MEIAGDGLGMELNSPLIVDEGVHLLYILEISCTIFKHGIVPPPLICPHLHPSGPPDRTV